MRRSLNDPIHTRSTEPVRRRTSISGSTDASRLGVDVDPTSGQVLEELLEQRDRLGARHPRLATSFQVSSLMSAGAVGDPIESVVVEGDQHAVGGDVDVGLEVAVAEVDGVLECGERVLGCVARPAAVGERDGSWVVEERFHLSGLRHGSDGAPGSRPSTRP